MNDLEAEEPKDGGIACFRWVLIVVFVLVALVITLALLGPAIGNIYGRYGGENPFIP